MFTLLVLSRFDESGAGPRYRVYQYFKHLEKLKIKIVVKPLLEGQYLNQLYSNQRRPFFYLFKKYLARAFFLLFKKSKFDLVLMDGELFPYVPFFIEKFFLPKTYIIDQDDAIFHTYDQNRYALIRLILGKKIDKTMRRSHHVIVGNAYVKERALLAKAKQVTVLPTVVDANKYKPYTNLQTTHGDIIIGWVGSPTTVWSLSLIQPALQSLAKKTNFILYVIGARYQIENVNIVCNNWPRGWCEEEEIQLINKIDIGIMPLLDAPYQLGKCGFKLIKYMACAKPMVACPVGMNLEIVDHKQNGFLAASLAEWEEYLLLLITNPKLRKKFGECGREKMLKKYSLQMTAPAMCQIIKQGFHAKMC